MAGDGKAATVAESTAVVEKNPAGIGTDWHEVVGVNETLLMMHYWVEH